MGGENRLLLAGDAGRVWGKWETAYRRHELWVKQGLWQRILRVLEEERLPGPAMKEPK